jgi:hypothetical protein
LTIDREENEEMRGSMNASIVRCLGVAVLVATGGACDTGGESANGAESAAAQKKDPPPESKPYIVNSMMGEILHEERLSPTSAVQWLELEPGYVVMGRYGHADKDGLPTDSPRIEAGTLP